MSFQDYFAHDRRRGSRPRAGALERADGREHLVRFVDGLRGGVGELQQRTRQSPTRVRPARRSADAVPGRARPCDGARPAADRESAAPGRGQPSAAPPAARPERRRRRRRRLEESLPALRDDARAGPAGRCRGCGDINCRASFGPSVDGADSSARSAGSGPSWRAGPSSIPSWKSHTNRPACSSVRADSGAVTSSSPGRASRGGNVGGVGAGVRCRGTVRSFVRVPAEVLLPARGRRLLAGTGRARVGVRIPGSRAYVVGVRGRPAVQQGVGASSGEGTEWDCGSAARRPTWSHRAPIRAAAAGATGPVRAAARSSQRARTAASASQPHRGPNRAGGSAWWKHACTSLEVVRCAFDRTAGEGGTPLRRPSRMWPPSCPEDHQRPCRSRVTASTRRASEGSCGLPALLPGARELLGPRAPGKTATVPAGQQDHR